ncbi:MAG TPA: 5-formyltetrahydrofolate cyclo-ligase [Stellaceae bacterium]|nr:5-formyltetrahydrofolate cyclo-ligase [Stellaceae bacterium]
MERSEIIAWRRARRTALIEARIALSSSAHRTASAEIYKHLTRLFAPFSRALIGAYWPFRREYNILAFLEWLTGRRHEVALPVVVGKGMPLEFRRWTRDMELISGVYDIPYPASGEPVKPTILLIPMVGFDEAGYRLGYGGGFYDRTIATYAEKPLCVGNGFELGRLATIYPLPHDIPMDYVVTESGLYRRGAEGLEQA